MKPNRRAFLGSTLAVGSAGLSGCLNYVPFMSSSPEVTVASDLKNPFIRNTDDDDTGYLSTTGDSYDWSMSLLNTGEPGRIVVGVFECEEEHDRDDDTPMYLKDNCNEISRDSLYLDRGQSGTFSDSGQKENIGGSYHFNRSIGTVQQDFECTSGQGEVILELVATEHPEMQTGREIVTIDEEVKDISGGDIFTAEFDSDEYPLITPDIFGIRIRDAETDDIIARSDIL